MSRFLGVLVIGIAVLVSGKHPQVACAQGLKGFFHSIGVDTARNGCWPEAFVPIDRANARLPFVIMVHNGWKRQNLIADHYFAEDGKTLTESGKRQIQWILTQAPLQHRTIFVKEGENPSVTQARLQAVNEVAARFVGPDQKADIRVTNINPPGWPAEYVDSVERAYLKTMPDPRLPDRSKANEDQALTGN